MTFKAQIKVSLGWDWNEGVRDNARLEYVGGLANGSGANQAEAVWHAEHQSLDLGESHDLDLTEMTRTILGVSHAVAFTTIKALLVVNESTDGGDLLLGGAASDPWSGPFGGEDQTATIPADSALLLCNRQDGWPVDSAAKYLRLTASGGDATYSIAIVGMLTESDSSSGSGE